MHSSTIAPIAGWLLANRTLRDEFRFGLVVIGGGGIGAAFFRPEVIKFLAVRLVHRAADDIVTAQRDTHRFQVAIGEILLLRGEDADHAVRSRTAGRAALAAGPN